MSASPLAEALACQDEKLAKFAFKGVKGFVRHRFVALRPERIRALSFSRLVI